MSDETNHGESAGTRVPLFADFPAVDEATWRQAAETTLKGAPFEKKLITRTYEGIDLQPIYSQAAAASLSPPHTLPGSRPYVRGAQADGYLLTRWEIAQELAYSTPETFNQALRFDMEHGQNAVNLLLDGPTRAGLDPDQAEPGRVGHGGVSLASVDDMAAALKGINLEQTPIFIRVGTVALPLTALLVAHQRRQGKSTAKLRGWIENDPLGVIAHQGTLPLSLAKAYDEMAQLTAWAVAHAPQLATIGVHGYPYHNSGANTVQELAFTLATGVEYVRALLERGLTLDVIAARIRFGYALGSNFFMEIAKLRAARQLWAQIMAAFGGDANAQKLAIHTRTAVWNKTALDPYVNMLRGTTEALAGAIGGCASMHVAPFDEVVRPPDEFSRRIARNVQIILQEECNLTRLIDPAGGSWYLEALTDQLARAAWTLFQEIERQGGMFKALEAGFPQTQIAEVAEKRASNLAMRRDVIVGTNMYPNLDEVQLDDRATDYDAIYRQRADQMTYHRTHDEDHVAHTATLDKLSQMLSATPETMVETAIEAARAGATLNEIAKTLRISDAAPPTITPVQLQRAAQPFEDLRRAAADYTAQYGHRPQIFMANMGPIPQHKARADFTIGFYEVGGFELIRNDGFATPEAAAHAALESGARAVVICSTDDTYPELVPPLVQQIKGDKPDTIVVLAGYPADQVEAHQAAGIDDFIHIRANCYAMNYKLQQQLGVRA
ncbi:MAG: methylmalonyl-CoA mutase [Chloroflexi bacterium]|nr:methylmalonyl-CoA mutase [Chloroflexota bacterium]